MSSKSRSADPPAGNGAIPARASKQVYRAAKRMQLRFGLQAAREAADREMELAERGDRDGANLWHAIRVEIERTTMPPGNQCEKQH